MAKAAPKKPMTKSGLYTHLAEATGLKKAEVQLVLESLATTVEKELSGKGPLKIVIPGIVRLTIKKKKAVKGGQKKVNPLNGQEYITKDRPAENKITVRPIKSLAEAVK